MDEFIKAMNEHKETADQAAAAAAAHKATTEAFEAEVRRQKRAHATKYFYNKANELCLMAAGAAGPLVYLQIQQNNALMAVGTVIGGYVCYRLGREFRWRAQGVKA